jgi:hypothetical protein
VSCLYTRAGPAYFTFTANHTLALSGGYLPVSLDVSNITQASAQYDFSDYGSTTQPPDEPGMNIGRRLEQQQEQLGAHPSASGSLMSATAGGDGHTPGSGSGQVDLSSREGRVQGGAVRKLLGAGQVDGSTGVWGGYTIPSLAATGSGDLSQFQVSMIHRPLWVGAWVETYLPWLAAAAVDAAVVMSAAIPMKQCEHCNGTHAEAISTEMCADAHVQGVQRSRAVGVRGSNQLLGGFLLHQVRDAECRAHPCRG